MKCPKCQFINPNTASLCIKCAHRFQATKREPVMYAPPTQAAYQVHPSGSRKGLATASLVIGIIGLFTLGIMGLGALIGITLGAVAISKSSSQPHNYGGKGLAQAGIVTNVISLLMIPVMGIIAAIAIPSLLAARAAADEASALYSVRQYRDAEQNHFKRYGKYADMEDLIEAKEIPNDLSSRQKDGYNFEINGDQTSCEIFAVPVRYPSTGRRSFCVTSQNMDLVHGADHQGAKATATDPLIGGFRPR